MAALSLQRKTYSEEPGPSNAGLDCDAALRNAGDYSKGYYWWYYAIPTSRCHAPLRLV